MRQRCSSCSKRAGQRNPSTVARLARALSVEPISLLTTRGLLAQNSACVVVLHHIYEDHWRIEE